MQLWSSVRIGRLRVWRRRRDEEHGGCTHGHGYSHDCKPHGISEPPTWPSTAGTGFALARGNHITRWLVMDAVGDGRRESHSALQHRATNASQSAWASDAQ